ncbi:MAG: FAD:protein FMN transferase [Blautia sp.]|nr:FAD:protein FMN transferase [Blautia sp.]
MKKISLTLICCSLLLALSPSGLRPVCAAVSDPEAQEVEKRYVDSMDTFITLTAYGSMRTHALDLAEAEILRLNDLLSTGLTDSEISLVNTEGSSVLSPDTAQIVEKALALYEDTDGLFDITVYPLMQLWGFTTKEYHVPSEDELSQTLGRIGSDRLTYDSETRRLSLGEGQLIDLGGIAKGYASGRIMDIWRQIGLESGMVSLGGNVHCLNVKPNGAEWVIAIRDPFGSEADFAATMKINDRSVITSGGYERYFIDEATGKKYQHIMDPRTGLPVDNDLASVSIISKDGMLGDGLSTSLYIMGLEGAVDYWRGHCDEFEMILIGQDGTLYVTEGLTDLMLTPEDFEILTVQ